MSTSSIDWAAKAKEYGAIASTPAPTDKGDKIDWAARAKQYGAIESKAAPSQPAPIPILEGYQKTGAAILNFGKNLASTIGGMLPNVAPGPTDILTGAANAVSGGIASFEKAGAEGKAARESSSPSAAAAHRIGQAGYTATGLLAPVGGKAIEGAGEQFGRGDISGGLGTAAGLLAPVAAAHLAPTAKVPSAAADVLPKHVEALTGLIEDKGGTVDPHETASAALPHLRETAVRMKLDPSQLKGREAGQATLKVAEQSVRDTQNEFNTVEKPYLSVVNDTTPLAQAYLEPVTPELLRNSPAEANALMQEASKYAELKRDANGNLLPEIVNPKTMTLQEFNQFRRRMNNKLDAFEKRGTTAQIMSDLETKAHRAAADEARNIEYEAVGRLSGLNPEYIRGLKQKEGALIEAKSSLEKEYNRASGNQGEAASKGIREKVASTYPSPRGIKHVGIKELIGPKPIDVLNNRIQKMFADMGTASPLPEYQQVMPPEAPQPQGGASGPLPGGEDALEEATRGGPGVQPPAAPDTSQTFVRPSKMGTQQGIADQVTAAKSGKSTAEISRVDQHKVAKAAIGEQVQAPVAPSSIGNTTARIMHSAGEFVPLSMEHARAAEKASIPDASDDEISQNLIAHGWDSNNGIADYQYKFANEYVEAPVRGTFFNVIDNGKQPTGSNYYGPGSKGVSWVDPKTGERGFTPLDNAAPVVPQGRPTVIAGQITPEHVASENAFYTQARAELGANAEPSAVLARVQALKVEHVAKGAAAPTTPVPPTVRPTLTQKMQSQPLPKLRRVEMPAGGPQSPSGASRQSQVTATMLMLKNGQITSSEADSRIQKLVGSGGRRTIKTPVR